MEECDGLLTTIRYDKVWKEYYPLPAVLIVLVSQMFPIKTLDYVKHMNVTKMIQNEIKFVETKQNSHINTNQSQTSKIPKKIQKYSDDSIPVITQCNTNSINLQPLATHKDIDTSICTGIDRGIDIGTGVGMEAQGNIIPAMNDKTQQKNSTEQNKISNHCNDNNNTHNTHNAYNYNDNNKKKMNEIVTETSMNCDNNYDFLNEKNNVMMDENMIDNNNTSFMRKDRRYLHTFSIDDPNASTFDDAISYEYINKGCLYFFFCVALVFVFVAEMWLNVCTFFF